jgi:nitroreductase
MELMQAIKERRTVRRFKQIPLEKEKITKLIDAGRRASCGGNVQRLRYIVVQETELLKGIFEQTAWGGFVQPNRNPTFGVNSPMAFLVLTSPNGDAATDAGAAIENIQLAAWEEGIGCCWIGAYKKDPVDELLRLNGDIKSVFLVALGYADECPISEDITTEDDQKYYLDENDRLHVPKYTVESITQWR